MLRDLLSDQSKSQENQSPQVGQSTKNSEPKKEDEEFVDINHEDAETSQAASKGQGATGGEDDGNWEDDHSDEEEGDSLERESGFSASISQFLGQRLMRKQTPTKRDSVHPFTSVLSLSNVEDCVKLENLTFPESERGSREKFIYRLSKCPELSFGIFSRAPLSQKKQDGKLPQSELVAHVISTRTSTPHVTDEAMALPPDWKTSKRTLPKDDDEKFLGHEDQGGTIAIHSLAVMPQHQGKGIGSTLLKSYVDRIREAKIADRIVLIAHEPMIPFYEKHGFQSRGKSEVAHGGGGWHSMALEFSPPNSPKYGAANIG
ncbi:MAG: hypothetical protein Q9160_004310 [Pyrenula sp. 1 TL-2023]